MATPEGVRNRTAFWPAAEPRISEGRLEDARPDRHKWTRDQLEKGYDPFERRSLPNALAKVVDDKSALRFARVYGLPDYASFVRAEEQQERAHGSDERRRELSRLALRWRARDPLEWVFAQARSVRFALELLEALPHGGRATASVLRKYRRPDIDTDTDTRAWPVSVAPVYGTASEIAFSDIDMRPWRFAVAMGPVIRPEFEVRTIIFNDDRTTREVDSPIDRAQHLVAELVNGNTENIRWQIHADNDGRLRFWHYPAGLVEVVWWHVQAVAVAGDAKKIALCELPSCGAPFIRTDGRQRFCPADFASKKSRCAALYQKRKSRGTL